MTHDRRLSALEEKHPETDHVIDHPIARVMAEREGLDPDRVSHSDSARLSMAAQFYHPEGFSPELQEAAKKHDAESEASVLHFLAQFPEGTEVIDILRWDREGTLEQHRISETGNAD